MHHALSQRSSSSESPQPSGSTVHRVGVIGGGQLAWMMAAGAQKLGLELVIQTPQTTDPAVAIAANTVLAAINDATATAQLAQQCDVVTFENEFVNLDALARLAAQGICFRPRLEALKPLLDKYHQRCYLRDLNLPTPNFIAVDASDAIDLETLPSSSFPVVLKTRRLGYDGQGTFIVQSTEQLQLILQQLGDQPLILEEFVPFERELAVMAARAVNGDMAIYPVVETQQEKQVCRRVIAPADVKPAVAAQVETIAQTLLTNLNAVGVFGIELFLTADDRVWVNEIAPRTHNSGHFTLDACETSQFEQQLRAVSDRDLGNPQMIADGAIMVNLLGFEQSQHDYAEVRSQLAQIPEAHVYWYGKTESRPGRKLGHVTVLLNSNSEATWQQQAKARIQEIEALWYGR